MAGNAMAGNDQSPSYGAFIRHLNALEIATTDPGHLASRLREEGLIDQLAQERAQLQTLAPLERSRELLGKLGTKIETDGRAFDTFLSIIDEDPTMKEMRKKLRDTKGTSWYPFFYGILLSFLL